MGRERYDSDFDLSDDSSSEGWLSPTEESSQSSRLDRLGDRLTGLRERLVTSERRELAVAFATSVGREAAIGAIKGSRLLEVNGETNKVRVRPVRLAMGALRPGRTLRRAATGAVQGARRGAILGGVKGGVELVGGMRADGTGESTDTTEDYAVSGAQPVPDLSRYR